MPRAIWSGSISFGLVNVPVKMYSAIREQDLSFHQFQEGTDARIRNKRVSEKTGKEVPFEKIVKGYEVSKGHYVMIDAEELEAFEPQATKTIDIEDFVALEEIDPIYYERTYYLAPDDGEGAKRAYVLLRDAMEDQDKAGIGRVVMRTKQYLAAIRPKDGALALSTMLFHDEVVPVSDIPGIPDKRTRAAAAQVKMAGQIIESLTRKWDPKRYEDTYRERVLEYIERKAEGEEVVVEERAEEEPKVVDLMAALEASLAAAKKGGPKKRSPSSSKRASSSSAKRASSSRRRKSA
ncbi:MAG: Ku protein [Actinomycetota bacterium]|nr:Ku protein [Actinomycetota bacterium]